jgi:methyl-accepting chemotaxis protein
LEGIRRVTEDAAENINEIALTAEQLSKKTENLNELVCEFNLGNTNKMLNA